MKSINGYKQPKFVLSKSGQPNITIELDLKYQSLDETIEESYVQHTLLTGKIVKIFKHFIISWTLDASHNIEYNNSLKIKDILNLYASGYNISLTPHIDVFRSYDVFPDPASLSINNPFPPGKNSLGNPGLTITFKTINPVYQLDWVYPPHIFIASDNLFITNP